MTLSIVADIFNVKEKQLILASRGKAKIARLRQTAMYLEHIVLGLNFSDVGKLYGRDRTTVAHGCRIIEDARDDSRTDRTLAALEYALRLASPAVSL